MKSIERKNRFLDFFPKKSIKNHILTHFNPILSRLFGGCSGLEGGIVPPPLSITFDWLVL